ncbi:XdhC family protein [Agrobacterium rosae]|uniref:XdhC family protein n=1 Tax=Agrobacterium rosae TaxID=1972867 RepID=A0AAE5VQ19_9HYPH|nr:XdhC family protein [Agrobacterium rosae]KAA3511455.1 XdhC family protein [Agrobacterium rosae]KAA3519121.1 XdhC family protein [Agrobacterium rosae]MBN7806937.1 XdhC family protein [Agrobacterium rosae]MCM2435355.1 XdhC/CoxF family protein [Agrobacterium rosae]MDX8332225.1 XdhC family protein [Agrobacterium rosae]
MDIAALEKLNAHRNARIPVAVVTNIKSGINTVVTDAMAFDGALAEAVGTALKSGKSGSVTIEDVSYFINAYVPTPRIVIIGAVHISQALVPMAKLTGFDVTIIDPRTAFATAERFLGTDLIADWPQDVLDVRPLDRHTALVALTHDPKIDDFPIAEALRAGCFYVGALGSHKSHQARLERLRELGFQEADLAVIHGPVGLNIRAASPAEIAVSILAEIIETMRSNDLKRTT